VPPVELENVAWSPSRNVVEPEPLVQLAVEVFQVPLPARFQVRFRTAIAEREKLSTPAVASPPASSFSFQRR